MKTLSIDIETYSSVDLISSGVYAYCEAPDFSILLFAYAFDDEEVKVVDLAQGESLPSKVVDALTDENIIKTSFNASFEITCIGKYFNLKLDPRQWHDTMALANQLGLPGFLEGVARALNLEDSKQKDASGKALIRYFSVPCKPTKTNGGRARNLPGHDIEKWELFKAYCIQDVVVEREIRNNLIKYKPFIPSFEHDLFVLDHKINTYGLNMDQQLITNAIKCDEQKSEMLIEEATELTGLDNPNSVAQLKTWIEDEEGIEVSSLNKEAVGELKGQVSDKTRRVLELRQRMSKTSVKKYQAMERAMCNDGRVRGLLQYYGANRTGRWAGRLVQVQNLPQNRLDDLDLARNLIRDGDFKCADMLFGNIPDVLSQLIRTAFIPSEGHRFIVSDFSAIEARIIAWLANEKWRLDVFAGHGKIYEASASQMFGVPVEEIDRSSPLRQKGKIAELALGYQGAVGALMTMGALNMGLTEEELPGIVSAWRKANRRIVKLWRDVENAAVDAVANKIEVPFHKGIRFIPKQGILFVKLPSGRHLAYVNPMVTGGKLSYYGVNQTTRKWEKTPTYGGKLVENIIQAIARDCLAVALLRLDAAGYKISMHVHDEVVLDVPKGFGSLDEVNQVLSTPIDWAPGLLLEGDGYETEYYKKD